MSEASRRSVGLVAAIAACAALLWWLLAGSPPSEPDTSSVAGTPGKESPKRAEPIGARDDEDDEAPSKLAWKRPGGTISGRVVDEDGKPVANADVCANLTGGRLPAELAREPKCTTSAADGVYVLAKLPPLRVVVSASAATYQPGHYDAPGKLESFSLGAGEEKTGIDIVLRSGGVAVRGVVKDIAGGVVEGAIVRAQSDSRWDSARGRAYARTDGKGEFTAWVTPGGVSLSATAEGYAPGHEAGKAPGYTFEILLTPESVLAGRVVRKSDGKPVADAHITLERWYSASDGTYTDADGNFRLDRLEPGRYKPMATTSDVYGELADSVALGLGQTVDGIVIEAHAMPSLKGRVTVAGTDAPCESGSVGVTGRASKHTAYDETGDDGEVEISALPADTYEISVSCTDYVPHAKYPDIVIAEDAVVDQRWEVEAGIALRGVVVDSDGSPVADATVAARPSENKARGQQTFGWDESTDADGKFELDGLVAGSYVVEARHDEHVTPDPAPKVEVVAGDNEDLRLVLEAGGTITGRVIDANRRAVPGASVRVVGKGWWSGASSHTADDGTFEIVAVRPGEHRVVADRGWFSEMRAPGTTDDDVQGVAVTVRAGETVSVDLVVEGQFGKIEGRVVDADGGPVDDAFVHATRVSDSAAASRQGGRASVRWGAWSGRQPALTDQDGTFALDDLEVGTHTVMAMRKGGGEGVVEDIETGSTGVVVRLSDGVTLSGKVTLASGGSPKRFSVNASAPAIGAWRDESFFETGGTFVMRELPPGAYDITVTATEGTATVKADLTAGKDASGISVVLTPKIDVTGTVVDVKTGAPVSGMKVTIMPRKGGSFSFGGDGDREDVSDESGRFKVAAAPTGPVRLMVLPRNFFGAEDASYGWHDVVANIPADGTTYELPPIRIAASKVKMSERSGDFGITFKEGEPEQDEEDVPLQIAVIRPGSPAAASELKVGDIITEVDGQDVTGTNRYLYHSLVRVKQGDRVTFGVQGGGSVTLIAGKPV
jgi:protocatechuate 3,4-dioxygenase beta subunit